MKVNGTTLEARTEGHGQPLILVHGSASDMRTWRNLRAVFAEQFRVTIYSRRFHWPNEPIAEGAQYSIDVHVEDLRSLIRSLGSGAVHLMGHSYGAFLCLLTAIREPRLVRTLTLAEPPVISLFVSNPPRPLELLKLLLTRPRIFAAVLRFGIKGVGPAKKAFQGGDDSAGIRSFGRAVFGPSGYDGLSEAQKKQVRDNISNIRAETLGPGPAALRPEEVRSVQIPTLLVGGERSIDLFRLLQERLAELLPNAQRITIPASAHAIHEDNPEAFGAAALAFLADHLNHRFLG